jgi:glutathione S-transferase
VAARARAAAFRAQRMPRYLEYLEQTLTDSRRSGGEFLVGARLSYADLSAFQLLDGLTYAFPRRCQRLLPDYPQLGTLRARVAERPRIAAYLASNRRMPFNEEGIFRHYPELDGET